ncbi:unnamed protein product [Sympodiomycopsis kandeliae]
MPVASTSALPPTTPRRKIKRKSAVPLSSKQYDRMTKQLLQIQQQAAAGHNGNDDASLAEVSDEDREQEQEQDADLLLPRATQLLSLNADAPADSDSTMALGGGRRAYTSTTRSTKQSTDYWLERVRKSGNDQQKHRPGKGPDAVALAMAAAKALQGKPQAHNDSFAHEGSFMFNPLGRRVPLQGPSSQQTDHQQVDSESGHDAAPAISHPTSRRTTDKLHLSSMPREVQEAAIMQDLLYVLMGIEGQWITFAPGYDPNDPACQLRGSTYIVDSGLDPSLRDLALRILPLATCYTVISAFIDMDSMLHFGTVTHALCAALRDKLNEYESLLVHLEHLLSSSLDFTLQRFWLAIHPTLHSLSLVYGFVTDVASITHSDLLEEDDDDDDDDDQDDDESGEDDEDEAMKEARDQMERERRKMFQINDDGDADEEGQSRIEGGIVKGGEVLSMLWDRVERQSGDPRAHELFLDLFHRASQPYIQILLQWITTGILTDSYDEFIVFEDPKVTYDSLKTDPSDIYWEQRYTLRDQNILAARERERQGDDYDVKKREEEEELLMSSGRGLFTGGAKIPSFLEPWKQKILLAGKYLNVVRECGKTIQSATTAQEVDASTTTTTEEQTMKMTDAVFFERIEAAYESANEQLLHLLVEEYNLVDRLKSLKHYFFFSSSDFFSSFIEQASRELRKAVNPMHVRDSVKTRLQTHLGMVLGSSAVVGFSDPYKEDVKIDTALDNPYESLKRIANTRGVKGGADAAAESIALKAKMKAKEREKDHKTLLLDVVRFDVTVKFPVSLVISRKNMIRWQFLHSILIQLKVTERQLSDLWLEHRSGHWSHRINDYPELEIWKMRVFRLRYRMSFFITNVLGFFTSEIIDPNWHLLESKFDKTKLKKKTVDEFLKDHTDFLNECRKECMLTDVRFVEFLGRLMLSARTLIENQARLDDHVLMAASNWSAAKMAGERKPPEISKEMWRSLEKQEARWSRNLKGFNSTVQLLATTDNPSALPLALRLQSA